MIVFLLPASLSASSITIDFETFPDSTILTTQSPGLTFQNTIILSAGISLNEFEFPPYSGGNVVSDNGGPMTINFDSPVNSVSGFFTYLEPLTLTGFNALNNQVAMADSAFSNNEAISGDPGSSPNELLQLAYIGGISSVTIIGDPVGGSFTLDDLAFTPRESAVPESSSIFLFLTAIVGLLQLRKRL